MARILARELEKIPGIEVVPEKVKANAVFAIVPKNCIEPLQEKYCFYVWDEKSSQVRFMTSFDTRMEDINDLVVSVKKILVARPNHKSKR